MRSKKERGGLEVSVFIRGISQLYYFVLSDRQGLLPYGLKDKLSKSIMVCNKRFYVTKNSNFCIFKSQKFSLKWEKWLSYFVIYYLLLVDETHAQHILPAIKDLVTEWKIVATYLGLSSAEVSTIDEQSRGNVAQCRREMIITWLKKPDPTREALVDALKDAGKNDIAVIVKRL